jgi:hypothetical protein
LCPLEVEAPDVGQTAAPVDFFEKTDEIKVLVG